jgi:hypothetical protein
LPLIALLLAAFGSVAWAKPKVAVLGLEVGNAGGGVVDPKDAESAKKLTDELRRNTGRFDLAPNSNRELQDEKVMGGCDKEQAPCMAQIGDGLKAEYLVYGRIEKSSEKGQPGYKGTIRLLNVKDKKVEETWEGFIPQGQIGSSGSLRDWSQRVNARLAGEKAPVIPDRVDRGPGKLVVKIANAKTGRVSVDGAVKGQLQDGTFTTSLSEGAHRIEIEAPDRKPYEDTVIITGGQTQTVAVELEEMIGSLPPPPPPPRGSSGWRKVMWASVATGLAGGGVWIYGWRQIRDANAQLCGETRTGQCKEVTKEPAKSDPATRDELTNQGSTGRTLTIAGITVVSVSGALLLVSAWKGYIAKSGSEKRQVGAVGRRTRREMTVTPVISPDGAGATVRFDW